VNNKITLKYLQALHVNSSNDVQSLLETGCANAVVMIQKYGLLDGCDIAIWERFGAGNVVRTVCGTGPICQPPQDDALRDVKISNDSSIPRSDRIRHALAAVEDESRRVASVSMNLLVEEMRDVSPSEFTEISTIVRSVHGGCEDLRGVDRSIWILSLDGGMMETVSRSWGGAIDADKYWCQVNRLLRMAGIYQL